MPILDAHGRQWGKAPGAPEYDADLEFQRRALSLTEAFKRRFETGQDLTEAPGRKLSSPLRQHITVFRCINLIASTVSRTPFELYWGDRDDLGQAGRSFGALTRAVKSGKAEMVTPSHPLARLFRRPNQSQAWSKFIYTVTAQLLTRGNFYILKEFFLTRDGISQLYPLHPDKVTAQPSKENYFVLDCYSVTGATRAAVRVIPDLVCHGEYAPDPDDPHRGIGPLEVARLDAEMDHNAKVYNDSMLRRGGQPGSVLRYKGPGKLDPEVRSEIGEEWERKFGDPTGSKVAVLNGDFEYSPITLSPKDMEFLKSRNFNLSELARAFDVPPIYLDYSQGNAMGDSGRARVEEQRLYRSNIIPLCEMIGNTFTEFICNDVDSQVTAVFNFDGVEALSDDLEAKGRTAQVFVDLGIPLNEVIDRLDLPFDPVEGGWESLTTGNKVTLASIVEAANNPQPPPFGGGPPGALPPGQGQGPGETLGLPDPNFAPDIEAAPTDPAAQGRAFEDPKAVALGGAGSRGLLVDGAASTRATSRRLSAQKADWWRAYVKVFQPLEDKGVSRIRRMATQERKKLLKALGRLDREARAESRHLTIRAGGVTGTDWHKVSQAIDKFDTHAFRKAVEPIQFDAVKVGVGSTAAQLYDVGVIDAATLKAAEKRLPPIVSDFVDGRVPYLVQVGDDLREELRDKLFNGYTVKTIDDQGFESEVVELKGWKQGGAIRDLMQVTQRVFNEEVSFERARTIARTEVGAAMSRGRMEEAAANGADEKAWLTSQDEFVRDAHNEAEDQGWIGFDEMFVLTDRKGNRVEMDGPHDPDAPPEMVINCRCTLTFRGKAQTDILQEVEDSLAADGEEFTSLLTQSLASGAVRKAQIRGEWNPEDHPKAPAGAEGGIGGQFISKEAAGGSTPEPGQPGNEGLGGTQSTPALDRVPHDFRHLSKADQLLHVQLLDRQQMAVVGVEAKLAEWAKGGVKLGGGVGSDDEEPEGGGAGIVVPESWDDLASSQQEEVVEQWVNDNYEGWYADEEIQAADNYAAGWATSQIIQNLDDDDMREVILNGMVEAGVTKESAVAFLKEHPPSDWMKPTDLSRSDDLLVKQEDATAGIFINGQVLVSELDFVPASEMDLNPGDTWPPSIEVPPGQGSFPGMEEMAAGNVSAREFRNALNHAIGAELHAKAEELMGDFPASDYVDESTLKEQMSQYFEEQSDDWKFSNAKEALPEEVFKYGYHESDLTPVSEEEFKAGPVGPVDPLQEPKSWELFDNKGTGYRESQAFIRGVQGQLTRDYIRELAVDPGVKHTEEQAALLNQWLDVVAADTTAHAWRNWKASSSGTVGLSMQYLASQEFGTAFQPELSGSTATMDDVNQYIREESDAVILAGPNGQRIYSQVPGMRSVTQGDLMRAHLRATWETTQYALHKAGLDHVDTYRGLMVDGDIVREARYSGGVQVIDDKSYIPAFQVWRNGLQSWTTARHVANEWQGAGKLPPNPERVVLRSRMPATAVLSVPAFGQNSKSEEELVALGAPLRQWDAWWLKAPTMAFWDPDKHPRDEKGRFIGVPVVDRDGNVVDRSMTVEGERSVRLTTSVKTESGRMYSGGLNVVGPVVLVEDHGWMSTGDPVKQTRSWMGLTRYSEDQARDDSGRWVAGGGGASSKAGKGSVKPTGDAAIEAAHENVKRTLNEGVAPHLKGTDLTRLVKASMAHLPHEAAVAINAAGEVVVDKDGGENTVQLTPEDVKDLKGGHFVHNHPSSSALSREDVGVAMINGLASMTAVGIGEGGTVTYTFQPKGLDDLESSKLAFQLAAMRAADHSLRQAWTPLVNQGDPEEKDQRVAILNREHQHVIMTAWAKHFGHDYERKLSSKSAWGKLTKSPAGFAAKAARAARGAMKEWAAGTRLAEKFWDEGPLSDVAQESIRQIDKRRNR